MPRKSLNPRRVRVAEGVYREGGNLVAGFRCPISGKWTTRVLEGVSTTAQAKRARTDLISDLRNKRDVPANRVTISELASEWLEGRHGLVEESTIECDTRYVRYIRKHFGRKLARDVEPRHVEQYLAALRSGKLTGNGKPGSENLCRNALSTLRMILEAAVLNGIVVVNVATRLQPHARPKPEKTRRKPRALTVEQIGDLIAAAERRVPSFAGPIAAAALTGGRIRECLGLVWADVDHANGLIRFREQISRDDKTRKDMKTPNAVRTFRIPPALEPYLGREARMKAIWSADSDFVFASGRAKPKSYRNWRRALASATEEAGLGHVVAHDLRHSVTSIMLRHGDVVSVSKQMGHANPNVTLAVYAHVLGTEEEQADRGAEIAAAAGLGY